MSAGRRHRATRSSAATRSGRRTTTLAGSREGGDAYQLAPQRPWQETPPTRETAVEAAFRHAHPLTVGVEEELMLVERGSLELAPAVEDVLAGVGNDERFVRELRPSQVEIVTPVRLTAADACRELAAARTDLFAVTPEGYGVLAAGTHPFSSAWGAVTDADRYRRIADEYTWAAARSLACGLHVHVAVPGAARALEVHDALRSYLPEIAALGGNSAIFEGRDTAMSSIRPKLNEAFPRAGIPPAFGSWSRLIEFIDWGRRGALFPDASHFWWDLRLNATHGTVEVRVADTQTRVEDAAAVVALVQALVASLVDRLDGGERLAVHETFRISENAWRAHRYGVRGWLVDLDSGEAEPTRERLARLIAELEPYARDVSSTEQLEHARVLLAGNGSDRQRYVFERDGPYELTRLLVEETESSAALA